MQESRAILADDDTMPTLTKHRFKIEYWFTVVFDGERKLGDSDLG